MTTRKRRTPRLLMLKPNQLKIHPENVRRFYPDEEVREMADSIRAHDGVLQALLVVPSGKKNVWLVVAGNKRLAGGRLLGKACPLLKCEPITADRAQQLLDMATENFIRSDPDAVSEGLHYRRLRDSGLSVRQISERTGIYEARIRMRLKLTELDEPIQEHMQRGKLPHGEPVAEALLAIPDRKLRVQLADRLASNPNTTTKTIVRAGERLLESLKPKVRLENPATDIALGPGVWKGKATWRKIRTAAAQTCRACNLRETALQEAGNPAWSAIAHTADGVCGSCSLKDVQNICGTCPLTEHLRKLAGAPAKHNGKGR